MNEVVKMKGENRLVVADSGWADTIPEWLLEAVKAERLIGGFADVLGKGKEEVGDAEACVYLYTASLRGPLSHEMGQAYLYLCTKLMAQKGADLPSDVAVKELSPDAARELKELKRKLWTVRGGKVKSPLFDMLKAMGKGARE